MNPARSDAALKDAVRGYWNRGSCDTEQARAQKFTREYFEEIEQWRYSTQPFIHSFAQFTRYRGRKVLEVGFGAGTDFIQWLRAGAVATGIDLTPEALVNLTHRVQVYALPPPDSIRVADAENLPFESNTFDLGYSYGVLHHSPDTVKAVSELVRVVRPGGEIKIMLYNRRSLCAFNLWVKHALFKARPWKSLHWALWHHMESIGTKGYSRSELRALFGRLPVGQLSITTEATAIDQIMEARALMWVNVFHRLALRLSGNRLGFFHHIHAIKQA